jgi:hypothetical protein
MRIKFGALSLLPILTLSLMASAQNPSSITQIGQLNPSGIYTQAGFGVPAISPNTIAVAAPGSDLDYGALYVFEKPSTGWGTMTDTALVYGQACNLGAQEAISNDGTVIAATLAGCYGGLGTGGSSIGVFVKPAGGWQSTNTPTATIGDDFGTFCGYNFAMSSDGKHIACTDIHGWIHKNYLYFFDKPAGGWASTGHATLSVEVSYVPSNVALYSDLVAVLGSQGGNTNGVVNLYQRTSKGIQQLATLTASDGASLCCEIQMDGDTIVVNGYLNSIWSGTAYVFSKPTTGWADATETAQLTVPNLPNYSYFGQTMALSNNALLVGGSTQAAYIFLKPEGGWQTTSTPNVTLLSNDPNQHTFGDAVAMLGNILVIGDTDEGANDNQNGAAYIYELQ